MNHTSPREEDSLLYPKTSVCVCKSGHIVGRGECGKCIQSSQREGVQIEKCIRTYQCEQDKMAQMNGKLGKTIETEEEEEAGEWDDCGERRERERKS